MVFDVHGFESQPPNTCLAGGCCHGLAAFPVGGEEPHEPLGIVQWNRAFRTQLLSGVNILTSSLFSLFLLGEYEYEYNYIYIYTYASYRYYTTHVTSLLWGLDHGTITL